VEEMDGRSKDCELTFDTRETVDTVWHPIQ